MRRLQKTVIACTIIFALSLVVAAQSPTLVVHYNANLSGSQHAVSDQSAAHPRR
jgi:hypothetical protein